MVKFSRIFFICFFLLSAISSSFGQVNAVTFGKNRVQYKKHKWEYYQTQNFNVYFYKGGQELAKFVLQAAEKELPLIEAAAEYSLQRRANIILYNDYADYEATNVGLQTDLLTSAGAVTRLVNNKMLMYYDANHYNLKRQIRQGIADIITKNILFGDDIGEVASNQALLDLPAWLTDGYVAYLGENWSTTLDDQLKAEILSGNYTKFSKLSFKFPLLAGHAFWYFIEEKYKKENVTYFLYLARIYKNLDRASRQITKLSFKQLQRDFLEFNDEKYNNDIARRKYYSKSSIVESFDINKRQNFYRFNVNPVKKNNDYVVTKFRKGIVRLILNTDGEDKTLLKYGARSFEAQINPSYPLVAWDPKGTRLSVIYTQEGKLKLFVYDVLSNIKQYRYDITDKFDLVQDVKYMMNSKTLLLSAVKNGHTDIYTFDIEKEIVKQITNDVYDDLDPTFVAFPGKTGIIFSSNRPNPAAPSSDTILPSNNRFNVFFITDFGDKAALNQITQLSNLKYGNARFPTPYNTTHFTFISDENGIANRYAGFFTSKAEGLDTLVLIGDEILRNPTTKLIDSTLRAYKKSDVDSIAIVAVSSDSTYIFPLSNYPSSLAESRVAGESNQVSEVSSDYDQKTLFKLKIDENTLKRRNITATPTTYAKKLMRESKLTNVNAAFDNGNSNLPNAAIPDSNNNKPDDFFQSEFNNEKIDTAKQKNGNNTKSSTSEIDENSVLQNAKLFKYKPVKFSIDYGSGGLNNNVLINRYQTYAGGSGPIRLNNGSPLSGLIRLGTSDLMEDIKINGGFKIGGNLRDNEWLINYQNLKRRLDWGLTYYRNTVGIDFGSNFTGREFTNLYQVNVAYPFDVTKSIRLTTGVRSDNATINADSRNINTLFDTSFKTRFATTNLSFVYDNTINVAQNILFGARAKIYGDFNRQINQNATAAGQNSFNVGFDARYYHSIFRTFIWAGRVAGDFSFGDQKLIYYLGGMDGWLMFGGNTKRDGTDKYFITNNPPPTSETYAFQSLAVNMRGFKQNIASGSNSFVFNSEFRLPVFTTLFDKTINNAFIRNFQLIQFIDIGTAWNGGFDRIKRPVISYNTPAGTGVPGPVTVKVKAGGLGPFAGGYGFGARSTLLGYFIKFDAGWPMNGIFIGKPQTYFSIGLDF